MNYHVVYGWFTERLQFSIRILIPLLILLLGLVGWALKTFRRPTLQFRESSSCWFQLLGLGFALNATGTRGTLQRESFLAWIRFT